MKISGLKMNEMRLLRSALLRLGIEQLVVLLVH